MSCLWTGVCNCIISLVAFFPYRKFLQQSVVCSLCPIAGDLCCERCLIVQTRQQPNARVGLASSLDPGNCQAYCYPWEFDVRKCCLDNGQNQWSCWSLWSCDRFWNYKRMSLSCFEVLKISSFNLICSVLNLISFVQRKACPII